ncbi:MAG: cytochrome c3 family protein [Calditrichaeota bacterium]|nr:cytochrome c3 family protein [Calditrichota bacterium]
MNRYLLLCLIGLGTGLTLFRMGTAQSSPQSSGLIFSHKLHVVENEMDCLDCHPGAVRSEQGMDDLFPEMAACGDCHDVEAEEECGLCHQQPEEVALIPRVDTYNRLFSHRQHAVAGLACQTCHPRVKDKDRVTAYDLPDMASCMDCHDRRGLWTDCRSCHLPDEPLKPVSHGPDFEHRHADLARLQNRSLTAGKDCRLCHQTRDCQRCHEGDNLERFTHPLNYAFTHALEAQGRQKDCSSCHRDRMFCVDCHRDFQVMPHNHVAGWSNRIPGDGGRHRWEALNDLEACLACHQSNAEQICQPCHGK